MSWLQHHLLLKYLMSKKEKNIKKEKIHLYLIKIKKVNNLKILTFIIRKQENWCSNTELSRSKPVKYGIFISRNCFAHQHNWNDLTSLGQNLSREWNIFQSFILKPAGENVRKRTKGIFVERAPKISNLFSSISNGKYFQSFQN